MTEQVKQVDPAIAFKMAIVRDVPGSFARCLARPGARERIDVERARVQHAAYVEALSEAGLAIQTLAAEDTLPDAPFIEDTAVIFAGRHAIAARSAVFSRSGEVEAVKVALADYRTVHEMPPGATLDGGDVLRIGNVVYVGLSERTNDAGVEFLCRIARLEHLDVEAVVVEGALHLKSVCTYIGRGTLLHAAGRVPRDAFQGLDRICAPEAVGSNVLAVNEKVIVPRESPRTAELLMRKGFDVIPVELSEFLKGNGGPTCLSLRL